MNQRLLAVQTDIRDVSSFVMKPELPPTARKKVRFWDILLAAVLPVLLVPLSLLGHADYILPAAFFAAFGGSLYGGIQLAVRLFHGRVGMIIFMGIVFTSAILVIQFGVTFFGCLAIYSASL